jgi:hypothetical protein
LIIQTQFPKQVITNSEPTNTENNKANTWIILVVHISSYRNMVNREESGKLPEEATQSEGVRM